MANKSQRMKRSGQISDSNQNVTDGLSSTLTGMGTANDKRQSVGYSSKILNPAELENAYRYDWIAGKAVDIPANDATREWRQWQADKEQITLLESEEKRLCVQERVHDALVKSRIYGGAAIVIGVKGQTEESLKEELKLDSIGKGDITYLHTVSRHEIDAGDIERNLLSPYYGQPKCYRINSEMGQIEVHPSRVSRFLGKKIHSAANVHEEWGDSIITRIDDAVKNASIPQEQVATLLMESNVDIIKVPDFMSSIGDKEYESRIIKRWQLAAVGKSINRALIMDKDEEWSKLTPNFSTLPELIRLYLHIAAAAADISAARFLGQVQGGLNSSGDSDIRNYYDNVASEQKNVISPAIAILDEALIRSALGSRPDEVYYKWVPLWQMSENEKADVLLKKSQAISNINNTRLIPEEALSKSLINLLIEDESMPGLDAAMLEYEAGQLEDLDNDLDEDELPENVADPVAEDEQVDES